MSAVSTRASWITSALYTSITGPSVNPLRVVKLNNATVFHPGLRRTAIATKIITISATKRGSSRAGFNALPM